ncbi:hypothetical protein MMC30_004666 [Trapelia coarctata]|nr:hypothetical protein [Trapelia coarctata]
MHRRDPRVRQTLNRINSTLESANLTTQASLYSFTQAYITPCLSSITTCLEASCYPCFGARRDVERRLRNRSRMGRSTTRGRPELVFDFYNDEWDEMEDGEGAGLLGGWGNDELDRLLAGSGGGRGGGGSEQPGRKRTMSYGSRGGRRKSMTGPGKGGEVDPNIVPTSSMFGFLERLPWKIGGRGVKYKPSAADLQEHPGRKNRDESEALLEDSEGEEAVRGHQRKRSGTTSSKSTTNSFSSRGDLFPSDDEDDAVPLDDEFTMALTRKSTNQGSDEAASGRTRGKRPSTSQMSMTTASSKETKNTGDKKRRTSTSSDRVDSGASEPDLPSMEELRLEEERVRLEEEAEVEKKRQSARQLALERGLAADNPQNTATAASEEPPPEDVDPHIPLAGVVEDAGASSEPARHDPTPDPPPVSPKSVSSIESRRTQDSEDER